MGLIYCSAELWDDVAFDGPHEIITHFSSGGGKGWICTRYPDHEGNHIGGDGPTEDDPRETNEQWIEWNENGWVAYKISENLGIKLQDSPIQPFIIQELY